MKLVTIFDVDGTIANGDHRKHFIMNKPKNWGAYAKAMPHDAPIVEYVDLCAKFQRQGKNVIFVSGREDGRGREMTVEWLQRHGIWQMEKSELYMRPEKNYINDAIIKRDILKHLWTLDYEIEMVYDDRNRTCDMWKEMGVPVTQVVDRITGDF